MDKFDNTKPNIILFSDVSDPLTMMKNAGIARIGSELRLNGYEVVLLNHLNVFEYEELKYILSKLISDQTLFVGFSNFFYRDLSGEFIGDQGEVFWPYVQPGQMVPHGLKYNKDLKEHILNLNPNCKLVIGGPISGDGQYNKDYDYALQGYADVSVVNLADHLSKGVPLKNSRKSIFGFTVVDDIRAEGFDITTSQAVIKDYDCVLPQETLTIEIARGCIFRCAFCSFPFNGKSKNDFIRSEDLIYQEMLDNYEKFGVTRYTFADDTFNDSPEKAYMINRINKRLPFDLEFWAYTRLDLLAKHRNTIDELVEGGQRGFYFGIESFNKKTQETIGKGMRKEKLIDTLQYMKDKWGDEIMLHGNFICGLPYETEETMAETIDIVTSPDMPLDSALFLNFTIENKDNFTFWSEIAGNPEKYGYRILEVDDITKKWENDHFTYERCIELTNEANDRIRELHNKLNGQLAFWISGLGFDLDFSRNKPFKEFPFNLVWDQKQIRGKQYRKMIYDRFNIKPFKDNLNYKIVPAKEWAGKENNQKLITPGMQSFGDKKTFGKTKKDN